MLRFDRAAELPSFQLSMSNFNPSLDLTLY